MYDHDRPDTTNPVDWEYSTTTHDGATVLVSKVGGGTLGRAYDGAWHYHYARRDHSVTGSDLIVGSKYTHSAAADLVADFLGNED